MRRQGTKRCKPARFAGIGRRRRNRPGSRGLLLRLGLLGLLASGGALLGLGLDPDALAGGSGMAGPQAALSEGPLPADLQRSAGIQHHVGDPENVCLAADGRAASEKQAEIAELMAVLRHSPLGAELLETAAARDVILCLDDDTELLAYYFPGLRLIGIRQSLSRDRRIAFLAHELAHVPQHPLFSDSRYLPPRDLLLLRRIREAAAEATATRIAWQLAQAGFESIWQAKRQGVYGDLARAFEGAFQAGLQGEQGPEPELRATRAAFDRWFSKGWRLDTYDRMTLEHLARLAEDEIGLVKPRQRLTDAFLRSIGRQGGHNYLADTTGPRLTDPYYRDTLSPANAGLLDSVISGSAQAIQPSG